MYNHNKYSLKISLCIILIVLYFNCIEEKGLVKELPQVSRVNVDYDESKALEIYIEGNNAIFVNNEAVNLDALTSKTKDYLENSKSNAVVALKTEHETLYSTYINVQNTIVEAINTLRQDLSTKKFNKDFETLNAKERSEITTIYPLNLIE
jgi:biopolymer transport protein ExbD